MIYERGTKTDNFVTAFVECQGQVSYEVLDLKFDTSRLGRETSDEFWSMMQTWDWSKDLELFWLVTLNTDEHIIIPPSGGIMSFNLPVRLPLLFETLSSLFPGLHAVVSLRYGLSEALWERGFQNYGGYLTITLSNGKVTEDDLPII